MITVTDSAVEAIRACLRDENRDPDTAVLRVAVRGGGCSGLMYDLSFEDAPRDDDTVVEKDGVRIVVDKRSRLFLAGLTLDYTSGLNGKGFVFHNPNAKGTCGCGESFAV